MAYSGNITERKAKQKAYTEANKEKLKASNKVWREANKDYLAAYKKTYRKANPEKIKVYNKTYAEANKEKLKASNKVWRDANKEKVKAYKKANKEKIKANQEAYNLKYKYNLTLKEKNLMLKKQNNKCKICKITVHTNKKCKNNTACIDHCHTTNKLRGILCAMCNKGLGHFKDNTELLTNAINYLEEAA